MEAAVVVVLCDNTRNNAENHEVVAVHRAAAVAPAVAAAAEVVAPEVPRPVVARHPVVRRIVLAILLLRRIAGRWPSA